MLNISQNNSQIDLVNLLKDSSQLEDVNQLNNGDIEILFFNDDLSANDQNLKAVMHKDFFSVNIWDLPSHVHDLTLFLAEELLENEEQMTLSIYNQ